MSHTIRVDADVKRELDARRLPDETNYDGAILRALDLWPRGEKVRVADLRPGMKVRLAGLVRTVDEVRRVGAATRFDFDLLTSSWDARLDGNVLVEVLA